MIKDHRWVIASRSRYDSCDTAVVRSLANADAADFVEDHHHARFDVLRICDGEFLRIVGPNHMNLTGNDDVSLKEASHASGSIVSRYARRCFVFAHAKNTVEFFTYTDNSSICPASSEHTLKCIAFTDHTPLSLADDAVA